MADGLKSGATLQLQADIAQAQNQSRRVSNLKATATTPEQARSVSQEFEAVFITMMISQMFKDVSTEGRFNGGFGEKVWREHMFAEYGKVISKSGGVGIADSIYQQLMGEQDQPQPGGAVTDAAVAA